ncbi:uncharacterized protein LOC131153638 [Malania oleifera]|uniref:uncharacterized protein LOC131153638 n=1 Tax=Malania oleifera TaxID=397392 RepID=UPI0025AE0146|nr:uncharacterized protein LOC131153638 [Malania oleifera]
MKEEVLTSINSSNIGYQLLKKHGWKEGTGLGASQQGRLEPVQVNLKTNKRGLGADKVKKKRSQLSENDVSNAKNDEDRPPSKSKTKACSKRMKKMLEEEKRLQEKKFEQDFFRLFWPDNV